MIIVKYICSDIRIYFLKQIPDIWSIVGYIIIIGAALGVYLYQRRIAN